MSLSEHLREPGDHGRLAFHPDCPVCRAERLAGRLPAAAVVSPRARAGVAAAALAATSVGGPLFVLPAQAKEPDQEREGQAESGRGGPGDSAQTPSFDPGGPQTNLPVEVQPAPAPAAPVSGGDDVSDGGGEGDGGAVEGDPATDPEAQDPAIGAPDEDQPRSMPTGTPSEPAVPEPPGPAGPGASSPPAGGTPEAKAPADRKDEPRGEEREGKTRGENRAERPAVDPGGGPTATGQAPAPRTAAAPVLVRSADATPSADGTPRRNAAEGRNVSEGTRHQVPARTIHVVQPGESLWTIARDLLGPEASNAQIARAVSRLWELNADRIASGDPDLITPGERLRLR